MLAAEYHIRDRSGDGRETARRRLEKGERRWKEANEEKGGQES